jgi:hypothetical protein
VIRRKALLSTPWHYRGFFYALSIGALRFLMDALRRPMKSV